MIHVRSWGADCCPDSMNWDDELLYWEHILVQPYYPYASGHLFQVIT